MRKGITLVTDSLDYHDKNLEKYNNYFDHVRFIKFETKTTDLDNNVVYMYDKNKILLYKSRYELIGRHIVDTNTWIWAWADPNTHKKETNIIRKIWNYGAELDPIDKFLRLQLTTSRFRISNPIQLEIYTAIASYLSKKAVIYKHRFNLDEENDITDEIFKINPDTANVISYLFLLDVTLPHNQP